MSEAHPFMVAPQRGPVKLGRGFCRIPPYLGEFCKVMYEFN